MRYLGVLCLSVALLAAGCAFAPNLRARPADADALAGTFPLIEDLGVDAYWVDGECRYLHYRRGTFSNDTSPNGGCRVWDHPDPGPLDDQANHDIDRLADAFRAAHVSVDYFSIEHDSDSSAVGPGSYFAIWTCDYLVFDPGYVELRALRGRRTRKSSVR